MTGWQRYLNSSLHVQERREGMTMRCQECGTSVFFVNPSVERVQWFAGSHRCGSGPGFTWQGTRR